MYVILVYDWKKWNRGWGTRCEESVSTKGQSQCEVWGSEYRIGVHLVARVVCKTKQNKPGSNKLVTQIMENCIIGTKHIFINNA